MYIGFPGELFLQMLRSLIIPLITTSIILAVASLDISKSKKIGCCSIVFYLASTVVAIQVGLILVATIQPGNFVPDDDNSTIPEHVGPKITISDTFLDLFRNFFPPNWLQATMFLYKTKLHHPPGKTEIPSRNMAF
uniref:Amino acid transporter n=1 Tax=Phlebotomus papatasi TaxID=29031 RepID=A0A1B0DDC2_PHLPP